MGAQLFGQPIFYAVISPRARGLSIGINMNPDRHCNFDCVYCEVNRELPVSEHTLDLDVIARELAKTLGLSVRVESASNRAFEVYSESLLKLRHVAISGDGEPTLCPNFAEAIQEVMLMRALQPNSFFKMALITNGTGLDLPSVQDGLRYFTTSDEIWVKLEAGTQAQMDRLNRSQSALGKSH